MDEKRGTRTDQLRPYGLLEKPTNPGRLACCQGPRRRRSAPLSIGSPAYTHLAAIAAFKALASPTHPSILLCAIACFALIEIAAKQSQQISLEDTLAKHYRENNARKLTTQNRLGVFLEPSVAFASNANLESRCMRLQDRRATKARHGWRQ